MAPPADPEATPGEKSAPGQWYGEYLWRIRFVVPGTDAMYYRICAIDAAGNKACTPIEEHPGVTGGTETQSDTSTMSTTDTPSNTGSGTGATTGALTDTGSDTNDGVPTEGNLTSATQTGGGATGKPPNTSQDGPIVDPGGCVCDSGRPELAGALPFLLALPLLRRRPPGPDSGG